MTASSMAVGATQSRCMKVNQGLYSDCLVCCCLLSVWNNIFKNIRLLVAEIKSSDRKKKKVVQRIKVVNNREFFLKDKICFKRRPTEQLWPQACNTEAKSTNRI